MNAPLVTKKLNNGVTVLAKLYKGEPWAKTFANRSQANTACEKAGEGWAVFQYGRPFYVVQVTSEGRPVTA